MTDLLADRGIGILPWEGEGLRLLERIRFWAQQGEGPESAAWTDGALCAGASDWLGPFIWDGQNRGNGPIISVGGLVRALEARLGWKQKQKLDLLVPPRFTLPNGKERVIDYGSGDPVLWIRLQDAFGIGEEKRILGKPVIFHLLSPADRPIQVTADLPGFWAGSYREVRKEMRGRYPKHPWPEAPGT